MEAETLLHYRIDRKLGEGGMGAVYLAEDTKLGRRVALKVLSEEVRRHSERIQRFRIEAKAIARLNHAGIATIFSFDETTTPDSEPVLFIVMEYVDGQPLDTCIPQDGLAFEQYLGWFTPLADALAHAHDQGVMHRDLKPGNVMITREGVPKILDFGLARIVQPAPEEIDRETLTKNITPETVQKLTQDGMVLGTPAYMSPEQATGQEVGFQSDIFSFGVMQYEALTGRRPFTGRDQVALITRILSEDPVPIPEVKPDFSSAAAWPVVQKCLQKQAPRRYQSMREVKGDLEKLERGITPTVILEPETAEISVRTVEVPVPAPTPPLWRLWPAWAMTAAIVLLGTLLTYVLWEQISTGGSTGSDGPVIIGYETEGPLSINDVPVISPDGKKIVYTHQQRLWIRELSQKQPRDIPGTDGAKSPFWSPNSDYIGYAQADQGLKLMKIPVQGGPPVTLCDDLPGRTTIGATWGMNGDILLGLILEYNRSSLYRISDQGGTPELFMAPDSTRDEMIFKYPHFLPDGQSFLFTIIKVDNTNQLVVQSGDTRKPLASYEKGTGWIQKAVYAPSGYILYHIGGPRKADLWGIPFSLSGLEASGDPFLIEQNAFSPSVSQDGKLVYKSILSPEKKLVRVDRQGKVTDTIDQPYQTVLGVALSPDDRRVAVSGTGKEGDEASIWIHDTDGNRRQLTFDQRLESQPAWSHDGNHITYSLTVDMPQHTLIVRVAADGRGGVEELISEPLAPMEARWSPDGRYLIYQALQSIWGNEVKWDLWYIDLAGDRKPIPFLKTAHDELMPVFSPDGRYVAFVSDKYGKDNVFVRPFPFGGGEWKISDNGGIRPQWNPQGGELFYVANNTLMRASVSTGAVFSSDPPEAMFRGAPLNILLHDREGRYNTKYAVGSDGQSFVVAQPTEENPLEIYMEINWTAKFSKDQGWFERMFDALR